MPVQDLASCERLFSRRVSMLGLGSAGNIKLSLALTFRNYRAHRYLDALLPHLDNDYCLFSEGRFQTWTVPDQESVLGPPERFVLLLVPAVRYS